MENKNLITIPFLKWAGGKRWFVHNHIDVLPDNYNRYIEPFLGSGAVFFSLSPDQAILSDINPELIDVYQAIKHDWQKVERYLVQHHNRHSHDYYYKIRASKPRKLHTKAARFIYLNRTCWNGLYRVNMLGKFNVPIGTKSNVLLDTDDFASVSMALANVTLSVCDFEITIDKAQSGDLIFVDPPYTVKHNHNGFIKYNEKLFSWDDQERLCNALVRARSRGASIVMTNANHPSVRKLYKNDFKLRKVLRPSVISGRPEHRKTTSELIVIG